ncbi:hypothetical protein [Sorangium sp. So ce131]|uniref:hypothetical protein n=1 Tax=Sorangium sp. So ce131 TaxID=3133282 RepID=UPI003F60A866
MAGSWSPVRLNRSGLDVVPLGIASNYGVSGRDVERASSPDINACWAGARDSSQLDQALAALDAGPMNEEELAWMRRVGSAVRDRTKLLSRGMGIADRVVNLVSGFGFRNMGELGQPAGQGGGLR